MYRWDLTYEITSTTLGNCFALRPCAESTELILGVYGRALARLPEVRLHALNPLSSHDTILLSGNPKQIPKFIKFVKTNVSKELVRLHDLPFPVFSGKRAKPLAISPDLVSMEHRLRYVLAQGTKEDLVESPRDWPGVTGVHALEGNERLYGWWFDRTAEDAARRRGEVFDKYAYATRYEVPLTPLSCWSDLREDAWRERVTEIVDAIEQTEAARRKAEGKTVLGPEAVMSYSPTFMPAKVKAKRRTPSPMVLASSKSSYRALRRVFDQFCALFRERSKQWREGDRNVEFPPMSFPPGLPMTPGPELEIYLGSGLDPG